MTIQRDPHPVFAALWLAWLASVWAALARPGSPSFGLAVLLAFFAVEAPATFLRLRGNARDTLSEIATWVHARTSKHKRFARGWGAALLGGLIVPVSWLLIRTVGYYAESPLLGVVLGALAAVFMWDHFTDTVTHG